MLNHLYSTSLTWIGIEVENMTQDEARDIWNCLKPFLPGVAARSGTAVGRKSLEVLRMMAWLEKKADTGE